MRTYILLAILLFFKTLQAEEPPEEPPENKKKILILSSHGGYGHTAAVNTLKTLLQDKYTFFVEHPIDELQIFGIRSGETIYNKLLSIGWIRLVNFMTEHVAPKVLKTRHDQFEKLIYDYIKRDKPDLLISLIPFINLPASEAARKTDKPFLVITTDNDLKNWVHDIEKVSHPKYLVTIGHECQTTKNLLLRKSIPKDHIKSIGLPLRLSFLDPKDKATLRQSYNVKKNAVALIMMGGAGGNNAFEYAKNIMALNLNLHLIVIAGKNHELEGKLHEIKPHSSNHLQVVGFTDKVPEFMAISDLIITKPGPGTINEAIHMRLPILIDDSAPHLYWEKANSELVFNSKIGENITLKADIAAVLNKYLFDEAVKMQIQEAYDQIPRNRFHEEIPGIIEHMCNGG